jgi:hypothetical protein
MAKSKHTPKRGSTDLSAILIALDAARALVAVSLIAVVKNDRSGPEGTVLRLGVEALDAVYDCLDLAIIIGRKGNAS